MPDASGGCELEDEVFGVVLTDGSVVAFTTRGLIWSAVDLATEPPVARPVRLAAAGDKLPMGIDREALLRVLDMRDDD